MIVLFFFRPTAHALPGKRQQGVPWEAGRRVRAGAGLLRMRRESEEKQDFLAAFSSVP